MIVGIAGALLAQGTSLSVVRNGTRELTMRRASDCLRLLALFAIVFAMLVPFATTQDAQAQTPESTGDLEISLVSEGDSLPLGGGCFSVTDASGAEFSVCDDDGDGLAYLYGLTEGDATVIQTSAPSGYYGDATGYATIVADTTASAVLVNAAIPATEVPTEAPLPTDTPTEEPAPTNTPTEEPTPTDTPTAEITPTEEPETEAPSTATEEVPNPSTPESPGFTLAEAGEFTVSCTYDSSTNLSSFHLSVDKLNPDDPDPDPNLIITIQPYDNNMVPLDPITYHSYDSGTTGENKPWRQADITITWPDGSTATATAGCNTSKNDTAITTQAQTESGADVPDGGAVPEDTAIKDTAALTGNTVNAGGTVTYSLYQGENCSGTPVYTITLPAENGVIPDSPAFTPTDAGMYNWQVSYSGDDINQPATSTCGAESVIVGKLTPTAATTMTTGEGTVIPDGGSVPVDTDVIDQVTLSGLSDDAGGTVTYNLYPGGSDCDGDPVFTSTKPVADGVAEPSDPFSTASTGSFEWQVVYSGDDKNEGVTTACGSESFTIDKQQPTATTTMRNGADDSVLADGGTIAIGDSVYDTATLANATSDAGGTVTYSLYSGMDCTNPIATFGPYEVIDGEAPAASPPYVFTQPGTYNWQVSYSGDDRNEAVTSTCGTETMNVAKNSPEITTEMRDGDTDEVIPDESIVAVPSSMYDTATLTGATTDPVPTGTVTYSLYASPFCTDDPIYTVTLPLNADGSLPNTPPVDITANGTYNWQASYSGDDNNNAATSACGSEQFFAGQGQGVISTQVKQASDNSNVTDDATREIGTVLYDTATLTGVTPNAGGTVTYSLYLNTECTGTPVFTTTVDVANGVVPPSDPYSFDLAGDYEWQASYSGDANNQPATSTCGRESVVITKRTTSVTTVMHESPSGTTIADNAQRLVGTQMYDSATINGGTDTAGGTVTYNLYTNANCSGTPIYTSGPLDVTNRIAPDSDVTTIDNPVIYNWQVVYSGDDSNKGSTSACGTETVYGQVQPTIVTTMVDENGDEIPDDSIIELNSLFGDTAELIGATGTAGGTVTYSIYTNTDCSGTPITQHTVSVTNGVVPPARLITASFQGTYNIQASYSGDQFNRPATSACGDETLSVEGEASLETLMASDAGPTLQNGFVQLPTNVTDTAILNGVTFTAGGTVTYDLYFSEDCSGSPVYSNTQTVSNHSVPSSDPFNVTAFGVYNWVVTYSGDANNPPMMSECGSETFIGVELFNRTVRIDCTYHPSDNTTSFRVVASKLTSDAPDYDPNLTLVASPLALDLSPLPPVTYHNYDSNIGPNNPNFSHQPWRRLDVQVTWPDGVTGAAHAECNTTKLQPEITTAMVDDQGNAIANDTLLDQGDQIGDTATLTGGTISAGGTATYRLFHSADCSGDPVFEQTVTVTNGVIPPSDLATLDAAGTYSWVVSYSGDTYNNAATSDCGEEFVRVATFQPEITTQVQRDGQPLADGAEVPVETVINDTATLTGATANAGGTVTYDLYDTADCSGEPIFTSTVTVTNGVVPPSDPVTLDEVGTYNWVVSYSGDDNNDAAVSACGDETVITTALQPEIETLLSTDSANTGESVYDTAVLTGATEDAGGTVTYYVYDTDDCSGAPVKVLGPVTVVDGVVPNSPETVFVDAGNYQWQAVYSGDEKNEGATSACGSEPLSIAPTEVGITKTADQLAVDAGDPIGYTITVTNNGAGTAFNIVVTDELPVAPGLDWTVDDDGGADCSIDGDLLTCTIDELAAGDSVSIHISSPTTGASCGIVSNSASFTEQNDPEGGSTPQRRIEINCPNVTVEKEADADPVSAGDQIGFTITVTNTGTGTARDVTLTDDLPVFTGADWAIDEAGTTPTCEIASGVLSCDFGDLAEGETATVHIVSPTTADSCGQIENQVDVAASNESDDATGDNSADASVTVECPNLDIEKEALTPIVSAGDDVSFQIVVRNTGQGIARDVVVTDTLPDGIDWSTDNPDCEIAGDLLTCDLGDLEPGDAVTITVTGTTTPDDCGTLTNTASVEGSNEPDSLSGNDSSTATIQVDCPDLAVEKVAAENTINAGENATFTITVTNSGAGIARDVVLTDTLPEGFTWVVDPAVDGCDITGGVLTCEIGDLDPGESFSVTVTAPTDFDDCGVITNTAAASASNQPMVAQFVAEDDSSTDTIAINCSDLDIDKIADDRVVNAGEEIGFTITVTNDGDGDATNVVVTDPLPDTPGLSWSIDGGANAGDCAITDNTLNCEFGTIPAGGSASVHVSSPTTPDTCGIVVNLATLSSDNSPNGVAAGSLAVLCPNVVVQKLAVESPINAGDEVSFTIEVSNVGRGDATDVTLIDELPAGIDWSVDNEDCTITDSTLTCDFGTIPAGESILVTLTGTAPPVACGTVINTADVTASNERSGDEADNSSTATVTVNCPDLVIEKSAADRSVSAGDDVSYTITVANIGDGTAYDVEITDALPSGVAWTIDPPVDGCAIADSELSCAFDELAPGASVEITVTGTTDAADCGLLPNLARTSASNEAITALLNNLDTAGILVRCPDIVVIKLASDTEVSAGDDVSFSIFIANLGVGTAYDVTVTDQLPAGIDWQINPAVDGCAIDAGTLTCSFDELAPFSLVRVIVTGETDAADCGTLTNLASATASNEPEDRLDNNDSSASIVVDCPDPAVEKSATDEVISAGDEIGFTITVSNGGEGDAYDVVVTDELPAGIDWTIDPEIDGCEIAEGALSCTFPVVESGESIEIHLTGETDAADCGLIENSVTISAGNEPEDAAENNASSASVTVNCPDVVVAKSAASDTISAGDEISFTITATNSGAGTAYDLVLSDDLPSGIRWTITPAVDGCDITGGLLGGGTLTCTVDELASGASVSVTVTGQTNAADCGLIRNTASATASNEADDATRNNRDSATVRVNCPDIVVDKRADEATVVAGDTIGFSIIVRNSGSGTAYDVEVTDQLPAGIDWVIDPAVDGCAIADGVLTCAFAELSSGVEIVIHVTGQTSEADCGEIANTAGASASNEAEDATGNNEASATVTVACDNVVIAKYFCVTSDAGGSVEFVVTTPRGDDGSRGCDSGEAVDFTITGVTLDGPIQATTDDDGRIDITLLSGTYTLTEDSTGESVTFTVTTNQEVLINVYNYTPAPNGPIVINKFWCDGLDSDVLITFQADATIDGCSAGSTFVQIDGGTPFRIGDTGTMTLTLSTGEHTLTEPCAGASVKFAVNQGETTNVFIYNTTDPTDCNTPTSELPNTGAGPGLTGDRDAMRRLLALLVASVVLFGVGLRLRRRRDSGLVLCDVPTPRWERTRDVRPPE
jgi:uncharacterized repeat protein (TIGR01451 family)